MTSLRRGVSGSKIFPAAHRAKERAAVPLPKPLPECDGRCTSKVFRHLLNSDVHGSPRYPAPIALRMTGCMCFASPKKRTCHSITPLRCRHFGKTFCERFLGKAACSGGNSLVAVACLSRARSFSGKAAGDRRDEEADACSAALPVASSSHDDVWLFHAARSFELDSRNHAGLQTFGNTRTAKRQ